MRSACFRTLGGMTLILALMTGVGSGLFHVGRALAGTGIARAAILATGVDTMPVDTARQVAGFEQARRRKP